MTSPYYDELFEEVNKARRAIDDAADAIAAAVSTKWRRDSVSDTYLRKLYSAASQLASIRKEIG